MNRTCLNITFIIQGFLFFNSASFGQANSEYISGQLFVKIADDFSVDTRLSEFPEFLSLERKYGIKSVVCPFILNNPKLKRTWLVEFTDTVRTTDLLEAFERLPAIDYAERVPVYKLFLTPNDLHPNQWNLPKIQAESAWDIATGSSNVVIAMVDDAVLLSHEDIAPVIWFNPGEIPGNGIDDDGNGYIDDINGWDAADNDNDPSPFNPTNSSFTHGTHTAGIAAAATDNNKGIASISYNVKLMAVKIANSSYILTGAYQGVAYAIAAGADIISMSWGGGAYSATYQNLFDQAYSDGIVSVAAAGNSNTSIPMYPAAYNHVISVGATNSSDQRASFSNYGATIDVMAPGVDIWSCLAGSNNSYGYLSGTSMACPLVSGLAALMLSKNSFLTPDDLEACLKSSCDNIDAQNPSYIGQLGAGRINAYEALLCLKPITAQFQANYTQVCPGGSVVFTDMSNNNPTSWQWSFPGGTPSSSVLQNPSVTYNLSGTYDVTLIVTNSLGTDTLTKTAYITVSTPFAFISGSATIPIGFSANLKVDLTGNPPWSITYFDGIVNYTINNITNNPYYITVTPADTTVYTLVSVSDNGCAGTVSGSAVINVVSSGGQACLSVKSHQKISDTQGNFTGILDDVDHFGYGLSEIGDLNGDGITDIAVGAIYDGDGGAWNGAVWILFMDTNETVKAYQKISDTQGNFTGTFTATCSFGSSITSLGDMDGDGVMDIAVGAHRDNDGGTRHGAVWILFLNNNGTVKTYQKISDTQGNFTGILDLEDFFGTSVTSLGDMDGDGITDIAVGAWGDDDGGLNKGAVWILFLNSNGTVKTYQKISGTQGNFSGILNNDDNFGRSVTNSGDLDNDSITDIAVGAPQDDDGGVDRGAIWLLFLNANGTVKAEQKISSTTGNFTGGLNDGDQFGYSVANTGDLDNDGITDIAVGALGDDDGGVDRGAVWLLLLNTNGTVKNSIKISDTQGNFSGILDDSDIFGVSVTSVGDLDGDGFTDIAVGAIWDDDGGPDRGAVWIINLNTCSPPSCDSTILKYQKTFGGSGNELEYSQLLPTILLNDGFLVAGQTTSFGGNENAFITKFDFSGGIVWSKTYGSSGFERLYNGILLSDSNFLFGGNTNSFGMGSGENMYIKTDQTGNVLWTKTNGTAGFDDCFNVLEINTNELLFTGYTNGAGAGDYDHQLVKTDGSGNLISTRTIGGALFESTAASLLNSPSSIVYIGFTTSFGSGSYDVCAFNVDNNLNLKWYKTYGGISLDISPTSVSSLDGNIIILSQTQSFGAGGNDLMAIKIDTSGNLIWARTYGGSGSDYPFAIEPTADGGFVIVGYTNGFGAVLEDVFALKMDVAGNLDWAKRYGGPNNDRGKGVIPSNDGGYIIVGTTSSFGFGGTDYYLIKTDACGNSGCNETDITSLITVTTPALAVLSYSPITSSGGTQTAPSLTVASVNTLDTNLCYNNPPPPPNPCSIVPDFTASIVCISDSTSFTDISTDTAGNNLIIWRWYFGDGDSLFGVQNPKHLYTTADTFSVTLIMGNDDSPPCFDTITKPALVLDTNTVFSAPDDTICIGDSIQLGPLTIVCAQPPYLYDWVPQSSLSDPFSPNPIAGPSVTTTYTVTVIDSLGIAAVDSITVVVDPTCCKSWALIGSDTNYCYGDPVLFANNSVATGGASYQWDFGNAATPGSFTGITPPPVYFDTSGTVTVQLILTDSCGTDTGYHTANIYPLPLAAAGNDTTVCVDDTIQIGPTPLSWHSYTWTPSSGLSNDSSANPYAAPDSTITYVLTITDLVTTCSSSDSVTITICDSVIIEDEKIFVFFVPDIFSPNNDGENDKVFVMGKGIEKVLFVIYDRWGGKVFESDDCFYEECGWDGTYKDKPVNPGVYVYYVKGQFINGETFQQHADITLVR